MKRRAFLKAAAVSPIVAPAAAKEIVNSTIEDLSLQGINVNNTEMAGNVLPSDDSIFDRHTFFTKQLKQLWSKTPEEIRQERNNFYISKLEADVYSLRSVSLVNKIRMSRQQCYDKDRKQHIALYTATLNQLKKQLGIC